MRTEGKDCPSGQHDLESAMVGDGAELTRAGDEVAAIDATRGLTASARVSGKRLSGESAGELDAAVEERVAAIIRKAAARARNRVDEGLADNADGIEFQDPSDPELKIVQYAHEIISEAELTAKQIIAEASARAEAIVDLVQMKASESGTGGNASVRQEPKAPGLVAELRKRFGDIEFAEANVRNVTPTAGNEVASAVHTFPVVAGGKKETVGQYSVHVDSGEVFAKTYEHFGRFLVVRGRITETEYRSLQQHAEKGQLQEINRQLERLGMRNYSTYDFPVLAWNARRGREDRFRHEVQFP